MNVDKARRESSAGTVDNRSGLSLGAIADEDDASVDDRNVGCVWGRAAAVINSGRAEDCIEQSGLA
jgi:hypothetical protein